MISGGAGLAVDKVAEEFNQAISNFQTRNPTQLTQIDVVIFEQKMYATFQSAILSGTSSVPAPSVGSASHSTPPQPKPRASSVDVNVTSGDILKSNCEVLINTTGDDFDLSGE